MLGWTIFTSNILWGELNREIGSVGIVIGPARQAANDFFAIGLFELLSDGFYGVSLQD